MKAARPGHRQQPGPKKPGVRRRRRREVQAAASSADPPSCPNTQPIPGRLPYGFSSEPSWVVGGGGPGAGTGAGSGAVTTFTSKVEDSKEETKWGEGR